MAQAEAPNLHKLTNRCIRAPRELGTQQTQGQNMGQEAEESNGGKAVNAFLHALVMIFAFAPVLTVALLLLPSHRRILQRFKACHRTSEIMEYLPDIQQ